MREEVEDTSKRKIYKAFTLEISVQRDARVLYKGCVSVYYRALSHQFISTSLALKPFDCWIQSIRSRGLRLDALCRGVLMLKLSKRKKIKNNELIEEAILICHWHAKVTAPDEMQPLVCPKWTCFLSHEMPLNFEKGLLGDTQTKNSSAPVDV